MNFDEAIKILQLNSDFKVFTYNVPFSLNIEKPEKGFPCPIGKNNQFRKTIKRR